MSLEKIALIYFMPGLVLVGIIIGCALRTGEHGPTISRLLAICVLSLLFGPFVLVFLIWQACEPQSGGAE